VQTFLANDMLSEEVFGPSSLVVVAEDTDELERVAHSLKGQLTAAIHGNEEDIARYDGLVRVLRRKAGRFIFNGFPTGVEVCPSMHHGGPYPATTDVRTGAVGDTAIQRFVRPAAWQNFPSSALPAELRDRNERGIRRLVDGEYSTGDVD
jgi:NADP-dependent aldehyde dehydrogenase